MQRSQLDTLPAGFWSLRQRGSKARMPASDVHSVHGVRAHSNRKESKMNAKRTYGAVQVGIALLAYVALMGCGGDPSPACPPAVQSFIKADQSFNRNSTNIRSYTCNAPERILYMRNREGNIMLSIGEEQYRINDCSCINDCRYNEWEELKPRIRGTKPLNGVN